MKQTEKTTEPSFLLNLPLEAFFHILPFCDPNDVESLTKTASTFRNGREEMMEEACFHVLHQFKKAVKNQVLQTYPDASEDFIHDACMMQKGSSFSDILKNTWDAQTDEIKSLLNAPSHKKYDNKLERLKELSELTLNKDCAKNLIERNQLLNEINDALVPSVVFNNVFEVVWGSFSGDWVEPKTNKVIVQLTNGIIRYCLYHALDEKTMLLVDEEMKNGDRDLGDFVVPSEYDYDFEVMTRLPNNGVPEPNKLYAKLDNGVIQYIVLDVDGINVIQGEIKSDDPDCNFVIPSVLNLTNLALQRALLSIIAQRGHVFPNTIVDLTDPNLQQGIQGVLSKRGYYPRDLKKQFSDLGLTRTPPCVLNFLQKNKNSFNNVNLSQNKISTIPSLLTKLQALKTLNLSKNQLVELPDQLSNLKALSTLNLEDNKIADLKSVVRAFLKSVNVDPIQLLFNQQAETTADKKLLSKSQSVQDVSWLMIQGFGALEISVFLMTYGALYALKSIAFVAANCMNKGLNFLLEFNSPEPEFGYYPYPGVGPVEGFCNAHIFEIITLGAGVASLLLTSCLGALVSKKTIEKHMKAKLKLAWRHADKVKRGEVPLALEPQKASAYEIGQKSKDWIPWAKSFFQGVAYREYAAYCAGRHDAQSGALKAPEPMKWNKLMKK